MNIRNIILPATGPASNGSSGRADGLYRHAYIFVAFVLVLIFLGFARDFPRLTTFPLVLHVHAGVAMLWMALVITQTFLISRDNVRVHRKLGQMSFVLAPLLVLTATGILYVMLTFDPDKFPLKRADPRLPLAYADLGVLAYFALFYVLAMLYRRDFRRHQRYLLASTFVVVPAALGRIIQQMHTYAHFGHLSAGMSVVRLGAPLANGMPSFSAA